MCKVYVITCLLEYEEHENVKELGGYLFSKCSSLALPASAGPSDHVLSVTD